MDETEVKCMSANFTNVVKLTSDNSHQLPKEKK